MLQLFQGQEQTLTYSDTMKMSSATMKTSGASESTTMFRQGSKKWSLSDLLLASIIHKGCAHRLVSKSVDVHYYVNVDINQTSLGTNHQLDVRNSHLFSTSIVRHCRLLIGRCAKIPSTRL